MLDSNSAAVLFFSLDHALACLTDGGSLVPFVVSRTPGKTIIEKFEAQPYERAVDLARASFHRIQTVGDYETLGTLVFDGFVTLKERRFPAIILDFFQSGRPVGFHFAQRYSPKALFHGVRSVGNLLKI
jgi:hypothetical protein